MQEDSWQRPDLPSKCTYKLGMPISQSPHRHEPFKTRPRIASGLAELIGHTPLVQLNRIAQSEGLECELVGKCEFMNPGGSVKDRIAIRMVEDAEKSGRIKPGDTLIEPTSGNTGIGLALIAAIKGYRCIIVMPEKISMEKENLLRGLGAEVVRTRTSAPYEHPDSHLRTADQLKKRLGPRAHILHQYINPSNPVTHFDQTAEEILCDCTEADGKVVLDCIVAGAGTGGTISGLGNRIKTELPHCKMICVDPLGSVLAHTVSEYKGYYDVEGIGYDFFPTVLDHSVVDKWYKTNDPESFLMTRRLIRDEGLLCGGSSGAAVVGAIRAAREFNFGKGKRILVILPDAIRNYMTKLLSDGWMYSKGFIDFPESLPFRSTWMSKDTRDFLHSINKPVEVSVDTSIKQAIEKVISAKTNKALVINQGAGKEIHGIFDTRALQSLMNGSVRPQDPVYTVMNRNFRKLWSTAEVSDIGRYLMVEPYIVVYERSVPWLVSQDDFLHWTMAFN